MIQFAPTSAQTITKATIKNKKILNEGAPKTGSRAHNSAGYAKAGWAGADRKISGLCGGGRRRSVVETVLKKAANEINGARIDQVNGVIV